MRVWALAWLAAIAGCGDAPLPTGAHTEFVIDHITVPTSDQQADDLSIVLVDGTVLNQFGIAFALFQSHGIDLQAATTTAIDTGTINLLADVQTTSFTSAQATGFTTYLGTDPMPSACAGSNDTTCGHQLTGNATFTVPAASPHEDELPGSARDGTFVQGPGELWIPLAIASPSLVFTLDLIDAHVELTGVSTDGIASGILAGAVTSASLDTSFVPVLAAALGTYVRRDCCGAPTSPEPTCNYNADSSCGCIGGSVGELVLGITDTSHTCTVTGIETDSLFQTPFDPMLTIDGEPAVSFGVGFTAVGATYAP